MALVSLGEAKRHLRIQTDADDQDINLKLEQANALILGRCNSTAYWRAITATWTEETVPLGVQAAILLLLAHLHEHRGDDAAGTFRAPDAAIWDAIERLIGMQKDPVLA